MNIDFFAEQLYFVDKKMEIILRVRCTYQVLFEFLRKKVVIYFRFARHTKKTKNETSQVMKDYKK